MARKHTDSTRTATTGFEADFGFENADTFRSDLLTDLRSDYVLANQSFNFSQWFRKNDDLRWQFGVPPKGKAHSYRYGVNITRLARALVY